MNIANALRAFDANAFAVRHGGHKESASKLSHEYLLPCPICTSDRLRWNHPTKQSWICWGCRRTGTTLDLVELFEKVDLHGAMQYVEKMYVGGDASLELVPISVARVAAKSIADLPAMPWPAGVDVLSDAATHRAAWRYLSRRGVDSSMALSYRIGFGRWGYLTDYLIFPCYQDGRLVYWQGRAAWDPPVQLNEVQRKDWIKATHFRKTMNPTAHPGEASAGDVLFNFDRARYESHVVVVEGPIDAMKIGPHAVALLGKVATSAKITLLRRMKAARYTVYLDRGVEEAARAQQLARELAAYAPTYLATPPEGFDAGALSSEQNAHVIAQGVRFDPARIAL